MTDPEPKNPGNSVLLTTYRFQVHEEFGFDAVRQLLDHLQAMGISHLYLSPIFEARAGSTHGYDATDPTRVRDALGGEPGFRALCADARSRGIGVVLDIVPNHMAANEENRWLRDVLEFGRASAYAAYFDLTWRAQPDEERIVLPILGRSLDEAIAEGELEIVADAAGLGVRYFERRLPLAPASYARVLGDVVAELVADFDALAVDDAHAQRALRNRFTERRREDAAFAKAVNAQLERSAELPAEERRTLLREILDAQHYALAFWRDIDRRLSYRRFFDITDLIGVRVEEPAVFDDTHSRILEWVQSGAVDALRIDHVDGLLDPTGYLQRLRSACDARTGAGHIPILVEKILAHDETLPADWPVDGTTGYEFLNALNGVFIDPAGLDRITAGYREQTGLAGSFADLVYEKKKQVLSELFPGEWRVLTHELRALSAPWREAEDALEAALLEITACLRVYRTYTRAAAPVTGADRARIEAAAAEARLRAVGLDEAALARIAGLLLLEPAALETVAPDAALRWLMRWQQITGPAMAKGLEDTALYTFYPLASANDVGGEPDHAVRNGADLHEFLQSRARTPRTMNATSTHDTKRSEDVRARLNVLSELADEWLEIAAGWHALNGPNREAGAPDPNEEYLLYQSIVGAWPIDEMSGEDFAGRMRRYMEKALREAKHSTSWLNPTDAHEQAVAGFIDRILDPRANAAFVSEVDALVRRIAPHGVLNSLAQVAIKAWAPGVPDFYQGTEGWAFDLVDPDNRRPVDFASRRAALREAITLLRSPDAGRAAALLAEWHDGRIKVLVTAAALRERAAEPALFATGAYHPLAAAGACADHLFGFARSAPDGGWAVLVVPRLTLALGAATPGAAPWADTALRLPAGAPTRWRNLLSGETIDAERGELHAGALFQAPPLALLRPRS